MGEGNRLPEAGAAALGVQVEEPAPDLRRAGRRRRADQLGGRAAAQPGELARRGEEVRPLRRAVRPPRGEAEFVPREGQQVGQEAGRQFPALFRWSITCWRIQRVSFMP